MGRLEGKIAVVTGAASGIGAATARLFCAEGATVILCDIDEEEGTALAREIGDGAHFHKLDVSDEDDWIRLVSHARSIGPPNILVNNAAIAVADRIVDLARADFERVLGTNLIGPFLGMKYLAPAMFAAGGGSIINVSSNQGLIASNALAAYASSKWGLRGLSKVAALELGLRGVRVNTIFPGPVNTRMGNPAGLSSQILNQHASLKRQPIRRVAEPAEVAPLCVFLASEEASYITGAEVTVDGGMTIGQYMDFLPGGDE